MAWFDHRQRAAKHMPGETPELAPADAAGKLTEPHPRKAPLFYAPLCLKHGR
jgi:hypothetical protein